MPSLRDGPPWHMTEMIEAEPALAERLLTRLADPASAAARARRSRSGRPPSGAGSSSSRAAARASTARRRRRRSCATRCARRDCRGASARAGRPSRPRRSRPRSRTSSAAGGLVIGISHEGGTWATNLALERARASGAAVGLVTVSERSPAGQRADVVVATEELDQSWCHTIGYLAPILAATAVGAHLSGGAVDAAAVRHVLAAGLDAGTVATIERLAAALAAARADHRHRLRRGSRRRPRAGAEARGGHAPPGDRPRPGDAAAWPPRRHGRPHRASC